MAVRLPDFTTLGATETGERNVPPGDIRPTYYTTDPEAEALTKQAAGLESLGGGLQKFGTGLSVVSRHVDLVNAALAQAQLHTEKHRLVAQAEAENDPHKIDEIYSQLPNSLENASQLIGNPQARELWKAKHAPEIADAQIVAEKRQRTIYNDSFHAGVNQQAQDLINRAAQSSDPAVRQQAASDIATLYSSLEGVGFPKTAVQEAGRKAMEQMITGRSQYLYAQNQPGAALNNLLANANALDPATLARMIPPLREHADTKTGKDFVRGQTGGTGGGAGGGYVPAPVPPEQMATPGQVTAEDPRGMIPVIRAAATAYGHDPDIAVKVAQSEGLTDRLGDGGKSGGAFQLFTGGGLGNEFQKETGLDPLDPKNEPATIYWAMQNLNRTGWQPYHGAANVGVADRGGILTGKLTSADLAAGRGPFPQPAVRGAGTLVQQAMAGGGTASDALPPALASHIPLPEMLDRIRTSGMSEGAQAHAISEAHKAEAEFQTVHHAERVKLDQLMKDDIDSIAQTGVSNQAVTPAGIAYLEGPDKAQQHIDDRAQALRFYSQTSDFPSLPPDKLQDRLTQMTPQPGQPGFDQQARLHQEAIKKATAVLKLRETDAAIAVENAPTVSSALAAARAAPDDPIAKQNYAAASLAEQARLGIPPENRRVLTVPGAANLASQVANADPGTVDVGKQFLDPMAKFYGPYWNQVFGDLVRAGLPPDAKILATLTDPNQVVARQDYQRMIQVQAEKGGHEALKKAAGEQQAKDIEKALDPSTSTKMWNFRASSIDEKQYNTVRDGIANLALYYAYRGKSGQDAADDAYNNIVGVKYDFDGPLRVPKGMLGVVERAGEAVKYGVRPEDLRADMPGAVGLPPEYNRGLMLDAIRRGYWMTNESDDGAILYLQGRQGATVQARKSNDQRIEFPFSQAPALAEYAAPGIANPVQPESYIPPSGTQ